MKFIFNFYCFNFLLSPVYDFIDNLFGLKLFLFDKVLSILMIFLILAFVVQTKKIYLTTKELLLILFSSIAIMPNLILGEVKSEIVVAHLFTIYMPFLAISFGASNFFQNNNLENLLSKLADFSLLILVPLSFFYFFLHYGTPLWSYFGYSSGLIFAFVLSSKFRIGGIRYLSFIIIDFFSGKRSSVLLWLMLTVIKSGRRAAFVGVILVVGLYLGFEQLPVRYQNTLSFSATNEVAVAVATGGRSSEWISVANFLSSQPYWWLYGTGFGNSYTLIDSITGYAEQRHYAHMQILSHTFTTGLFCSILFQLYLIINIISFLRFSDKIKFIYFFLIFYILSFLSASLLVEILPWIIFGFLRRSLKKNATK